MCRRLHFARFVDNVIIDIGILETVETEYYPGELKGNNIGTFGRIGENK